MKYSSESGKCVGGELATSLNSFVSRLIPTLLATLGLSRETKATSESKIVSVAHSLQMNEDSLPGWFWTVNYELVCFTYYWFSWVCEIFIRCDNVGISSEEKGALPNST